MDLSTGERVANCTDVVSRYQYSVIDLYGSTQGDPDGAEGSTRIARVRIASGTFTAGQTANGLEWQDNGDGTMSKPSGVVWSGPVENTGVVTHGIVRTNAAVEGASTTAPRMVLSAANSGAEITMSNTSLTAGGTATIDDCVITFAESA